MSIVEEAPVGVNNKARRAAKKRKRGAGRGAGGPGSGHSSPYGADAFGQPDEHDLAALLVSDAVGACSADPGAVGVTARGLTGPDCPVSRRVLGATLHRHLAGRVATASRGGWSPHDLAEIVHRRLTAAHLPLVANLLQADAAAHSVGQVADQWRAELDSLGSVDHAPLLSAEGITLALGLAALLARLPRIAQLVAAPGDAGPVAGRTPGQVDAKETKLLARVRALLAKAESTDFPAEAEALSAKAQDLISRYSLDRLAAAGQADEPGSAGTAVVARRLWIDAPYVLPKAMLVDQVATANRCSAVTSEDLGFVSLVGAPGDLDAVELLSTSLMVQADASLIRAGRHTSRDGTSRTRSFRRSFLMSYAVRIGERLREADREATASSSRSGELVPLLRDHAERVTAVVEELFPNIDRRAPKVGSWQGWAEGRAAADLASLDTHLAVSREAG